MLNEWPAIIGFWFWGFVCATENRTMRAHGKV